MNLLVRILRDDDLDVKIDAEVWHLVDPANFQAPAALCTSEFFGVGESRCLFEEKSVERGGITCPECPRIVKIYKAVRL